MIQKNIKKALIGGLSILAVSCAKDPQSPGTEFMPDMYRGPAFETYGENGFFKDSLNSRKPVDGTISRGRYAESEFSVNSTIYQYPNTPEGYEAAGANLRNPIAVNDKNTEEGKALYEKFCVNCHGSSGNGDGSIVAGGKFPSPGKYADKFATAGLNDGKMFHAITYGKGLMGSHASQVTKEERWKIIMYINKMNNRVPGAPTAAPADTAAAKKIEEPKKG